MKKIKKIELIKQVNELKCDLYYALGHIQGCGHSPNYLTEKYQEVINKMNEKNN